ncbi:hypothetical protein RsTz2092_02540 [Deferribacterales bacterium RsTz2092]
MMCSGWLMAFLSRHSVAEKVGLDLKKAREIIGEVKTVFIG